jgi:PAS domain S-box-containing protein
MLPIATIVAHLGTTSHLGVPVILDKLILFWHTRPAIGREGATGRYGPGSGYPTEMVALVRGAAHRGLGSTTYDDAGKPRRMSGVCIDITALRQAETQYRTVIQTTIDGFWLNDSAGRLVDVNDAYCQMIGYGREELLTMSVSDVEAVEKPQDTAAHLEKVMRTGADRFESQHRCKDGRIIDVAVSSNFLKENGSFFVFLRDVTERKRLEEEIRQSGKMRAIGHLAGEARRILDEGVRGFLQKPFQKAELAAKVASILHGS